MLTRPNRHVAVVKARTRSRGVGQGDQEQHSTVIAFRKVSHKRRPAPKFIMSNTTKSVNAASLLRWVDEIMRPISVCSFSQCPRDSKSPGKANVKVKLPNTPDIPIFKTGRHPYILWYSIITGVRLISGICFARSYKKMAQSTRCKHTVCIYDTGNWAAAAHSAVGCIVLDAYTYCRQ